MQLRYLSTGMRFVLCRSKEKFHLVDARSQGIHKAVVNSNFEPSSLHVNCQVKPIIRCSNDCNEVNIQMLRFKTAQRLSAKAPMSMTAYRRPLRKYQSEAVDNG